MAPLTRDEAAAAVAQAIQEVQQGALVSLDRMGTSAQPMLGLWRALGKPSLRELSEHLSLVATWAREAPDALAAHDIRGEGWRDGAGVDRSRSMQTLTVQRRWDERLAAAQAWDRAGRPYAGTTPRPASPPSTKAQRDQDSLDDLARWRAELDARRAALDAEDERSAQHGAAHPTNPASTPPKEFDHADAD